MTIEFGLRKTLHDNIVMLKSRGISADAIGAAILQSLGALEIAAQDMSFASVNELDNAIRRKSARLSAMRLMAGGSFSFLEDDDGTVEEEIEDPYDVVLGLVNNEIDTDAGTIAVDPEIIIDVWLEALFALDLVWTDTTTICAIVLASRSFDEEILDEIEEEGLDLTVSIH